MFIETVLQQDRPVWGGPPTATVPWLGALIEGSKDVGMFLAALLCGPSTEGEKTRVAAAGGVLSAIGYFSGRSAESDIVLPDEEAPLLEAVLAANLGDLGSSEASDSSNVTFQEIMSDRAAAQKELKEAFAMLNKEFSTQAIAARPILRDTGS